MRKIVFSEAAARGGGEKNFNKRTLRHFSHSLLFISNLFSHTLYLSLPLSSLRMFYSGQGALIQSKVTILLRYLLMILAPRIFSLSILYLTCFTYQVVPTYTPDNNHCREKQHSITRVQFDCFGFIQMATYFLV